MLRVDLPTMSRGVPEMINPRNRGVRKKEREREQVSGSSHSHKQYVGKTTVITVTPETVTTMTLRGTGYKGLFYSFSLLGG